MESVFVPPSARQRLTGATISARSRAAVDTAVQPLRALHPSCPRHRRSHANIQPLGGSAKRSTDILISALALVVLLPLLALVAILIKLESPGPILFLQRRGGFRGKTFLIYKFRTMKTLDDGKAIRQATPKDDRVTRIGGLLRKTSVDELPQLLNVLKGEMSIVGPRPHAVAHDIHFETIEPTYRERREARPGITGLAQVSGHRGLASDAESVKARIRCDIAYVENWSWRLDASIILRTFAVVFRHQNAF